MGSVIKKRRKRMAKKKHRKLLKRLGCSAATRSSRAPSRVSALPSGPDGSCRPTASLPGARGCSAALLGPAVVSRLWEAEAGCGNEAAPGTGDEMSGSWISFLSDYGFDDACVGVCQVSSPARS